MLRRQGYGCARRYALVWGAYLVLGGLMPACSDGEGGGSGAPGGATSAAFAGSTFLRPAANLPPERRADFWAGKALAGQPWVRAPSSTDARDGLGPLYDARTCFECHVEGGRGESPESGGPLPPATVVRLGRPSAFGGPAGAALDATYGDQLQRRSISLAHQLRAVRAPTGPGPVPAEGEVVIDWSEERFEYPDGRQVHLRRPTVALGPLGYGPLEPGTKVGLRHAPPLFGVGLLDRVSEASILAGADPDDADGDGISGRANRVWDPEQRAPRVGRFGWKASLPSLRAQAALALRNDIGITSSIYSSESCTDAQPGCGSAPSGRGEDGVEIADPLLDLVVEFNAAIAVPTRRKPDHAMVRRGGRIFEEVGCHSCHRPSFETRFDATAPHLSEQTIWPYTDLLLHDLGEDLADELPSFEATGREWRTAPLWGVGLARAVRSRAGLLHDGRARTVEEAILWHGGEAARAREAFIRRSEDERSALIAFVKSL